MAARLGSRGVLRRLAAAGAVGIAAGLLLHFTGVCPVVKRIGTPARTLFGGGLCFLFLAGFCWLTEVKGYRKWAFPLVVIGANSMAAYLMARLWERFSLDSFRIHLGAHAFAFLGTAYEPLLRGLAVLVVYWVVLSWMSGGSCFLRSEGNTVQCSLLSRNRWGCLQLGRSERVRACETRTRPCEATGTPR